MDIELKKEKICINKLICQKKELVFVSNDMIVPDAKPDILNTINATGNICIYKKEIKEGMLKIDGSLITYIMYLPDSKEDNLRALNCNLDFNESINIPNLKEGMIVTLESEIKDIECKVINGRKVNIKAGVEFFIKVYSNEEVDYITSIDNISDIQTLHKDFNINSLIGNGKTTCFAKDTLSFEAKDEFAEILKLNVNLINKDIKLSFNKVLAKVEAEIKIMYLTEDNRIGKCEGLIPVVGFIDVQNISEENICDVNYEVKNILVRPNSAEEHSIYVELEIEPSCMVYENKKLSLMQDLYSPTTNLEYSEKMMATLSDNMEKSNEFTIKENINIPGLEDNNLLDVEVIPILLNTEIDDSKIKYIGNLNLNFMFLKDNSINSRSAKIPFELSIDNNEDTKNIIVDPVLKIKNTKFDIKSDGNVDAKIELKINTKMSKNVSMNLIDNIKFTENQNRYENEDYDSLILYIVKPGDTLWKIAKKFNTTIEELAKKNGIEDVNKINVGQKIYIPKFNSINREVLANGTQPIFV